MTDPSKGKRLSKFQTQVLLKIHKVKPSVWKKEKCRLGKSRNIRKERVSLRSKNRRANTKETGLLLEGESISNKFQYYTISVKQTMHTCICVHVYIP